MLHWPVGVTVSSREYHQLGAKCCKRQPASAFMGFPQKGAAFAFPPSQIMLLQMAFMGLSSARYGPEVGVNPVPLVGYKELLLTAA